MHEKQHQPEKRQPVIMVAEDDRINLLVARKMVSNILPQAQIIEATDGAAAVELFRDHRPQLIFMDLQMPHTDGYQATAEIIELAAAGGEAPSIVALTAGVAAGEDERCREAGMDGFLTKPIERGRLQEIIESVFGP